MSDPGGGPGRRRPGTDAGADGPRVQHPGAGGHCQADRTAAAESAPTRRCRTVTPGRGRDSPAAAGGPGAGPATQSRWPSRSPGPSGSEAGDSQAPGLAGAAARQIM